MTTDIQAKTKVSLPLAMLGSLLAAAVGAGISIASTTSTVARVEAAQLTQAGRIERLVERVEQLQTQQSERLAGHETRLALVERAVLSLEQMAKERVR